MTITIKDAQIASDRQFDISRIVEQWVAFRQHVGTVEVSGWDSDGFNDALRIPAFVIAEAVRQRLQKQIDDLNQEISNLGITPNVVELATMSELVEPEAPASDVAAAC